MRVLIAEDDALLGEGIQAALKIAGYVVDWARDGQEAMLALNSEECAVCVLDLSMPKLSGLSILRTLRQKGNN